MNKLLVSLLAGTAVIAFCMGSASAAELRVNGSTTVKAVLFDAHQSELEKETGNTYKVVGNGSGHGLEDLLKGNADIAMISASLESEKPKVNGDGKDMLVEAPIGTSTIAFVTKKDNKVSSLTSDQVKGILAGTTTNWKAVGGDDAPITVISEVEGGGIRSTVEKKLIGGPIKANAKTLPNAPQVVKIASQLPGSFGIATASTADASVKTIAIDAPIQQPLAFVTKGPASADAQKLIDAAKKVGLK